MRIGGEKMRASVRPTLGDRYVRNTSRKKRMGSNKPQKDRRACAAGKMGLCKQPDVDKWMSNTGKKVPSDHEQLGE